MEQLPLWFLWISLTITILYSLSHLRLSSKNPGLPPGPTPLPIVGNLFDLGDQPHKSLARLAKIHGQVMSLKFGLTTTIIVSSPDAAREALQKKDQVLAARWIPDTLHACNHHDSSIVWLPSSSTKWKSLRSISNTYLLSPRCLETTRAIRERKARELVIFLSKQAGRQVDLKQTVFGFVLNVISNILFSEDVVDLDNLESPEEFKELISRAIEQITKPNVSDFFPFLRPLDLRGQRRCTAGYLKKFYNFFDGVIDRRLKMWDSGDTRYGDFLDSLLELYLASKLDMRSIKILLTDYFAAASSTSSITVDWAMAELLHDPIAMAKAHAELRKTIGSKQLGELDIVKLPDLQAVVKEIMRLHPAGPLLLPHTAMEDGVELCGYVVPKGARVLINAWAIGRDPTVWTEPNVFKPERFLEREVDFRGKDFEFIPFGSGRRICPGMPLAVRMVPLFLATMLHAFEWKLPEGIEPQDVDLTEKFASTLELVVPLKAIPVPVLSY